MQPLALEDDIGVCGYALAALDSASFYATYSSKWVPLMRQAYAGIPTSYTHLGEARTRAQRLVDELFTKDLLKDEWLDKQPLLEAYPSHLHIDLIARAQGKGWGVKLMAHLLALLKEKVSIFYSFHDLLSLTVLF